MKTTGNPDHDFAMMMKIHHQGAIDMAQMELKSGKDATMREMAKKVISAQQKEGVGPVARQAQVKSSPAA